jgi:stage V sporulation protein B
LYETLIPITGGIALTINKKSIFYGAVALTLSNIVIYSLSFVYRIFISRITGAEGMGVYQLIFPFYSVIMAISLSGICMAVSRISAERSAMGDKMGIYQLIRISISIFLILFVIVAIPSLLFSQQIAGGIIGDIRTRIPMILLIPCLFFTGFENILKACFYGVRNIKPPIISSILEQIVRISAVVVLLLTFTTKDVGITTSLIVLGMSISEIASSTCLIIFYKKKMPRPNFSYKKTPSSGLLGDIGAIAVPVSIASLAENLLVSANAVLIPRRLIVAGMTLHQAVSIYGIILGMTLPLIMLPSSFFFALSTIILPKLSEGMALKNFEDVKRKIGKSIHITGLLALPAIALLIPVAPTLCELLYKQSIAGEYFTPLALASIFAYYQIITNSILNGIGMQKTAAASMIIEGVIQLLFTYFAVGNPHLGIYGFIIGFFISSGISVCINMFGIMRKTNLDVKWALWFIQPILSAAITGFITHLIFVRLISIGILPVSSIIISLLSGGFLYYIITQLQGISITRYIKTLIPKGNKVVGGEQ